VKCGAERGKWTARTGHVKCGAERGHWGTDNSVTYKRGDDKICMVISDKCEVDVICTYAKRHSQV
jgi:hypothetical protein